MHYLTWFNKLVKCGQWKFKLIQSVVPTTTIGLPQTHGLGVLL